MAKTETGTDYSQASTKFHETTLEKRILHSNLSDEDKIEIIQMIGNRPSVISIPSVWTPDSQPLNPIYKNTPEYVVTCSSGNDTCPHARVSSLKDEE
jgi:hypothetical protein